MKTPPTSHAAAMGQMPNRECLIRSSRRRPTTAAGTKATARLPSSFNPSLSRPSMPPTILRIRPNETRNTAMIAPACMQMANASDAAFSSGVAVSPRSSWTTER